MQISYVCLSLLLERTLSYYCEQFIPNLDVKIAVIRSRLVKLPRLIIVTDIHYYFKENIQTHKLQTMNNLVVLKLMNLSSF